MAIAEAEKEAVRMQLRTFCERTLEPTENGKFLCPFCGDRDGISINPRDPVHWHCFSGKHPEPKSGDIYDIAEILCGSKDLTVQHKYACEVLGLTAGDVPKPDPAKLKEEEAKAAAELEKKRAERRRLLDMAYKQSAGGLSGAVLKSLQGRGIAGEALRILRTMPTVDVLSLHTGGNNYIVFAPVAENRYIPALSNPSGCFLSRNIRPKSKEDRYLKSGSIPPILFAGDNTQKAAAGVLAVTEGCFDAFAFYLTGCPALSLNGVSNAAHFQTYLTAIKTAGFKVIIAAGDADKAGQDMNQVIISACAAAGVPCVPLDYGNLKDTDPADLSKNGKYGLLQSAVQRAIKAYKKETPAPAKAEPSADAVLAPLAPAGAGAEKAPAKPDPASNPAELHADEAAAVPSSGEPAKLKAPFRLQTAALPPAKDKETAAEQIIQIAKVLSLKNRFYMQGESLFADYGHILEPVGICELQQAISDIKALSPEVCAVCKYPTNTKLLKEELLTAAKMASRDLQEYPLDAHSIACKNYIFEILADAAGKLKLKATPKAEYKGRPVRTETNFTFLPAITTPPPAFKYFLDSITAGMPEDIAALEQLYICLLVAAAAVPWISRSCRALFWINGQPHTGKTELLCLLREIAGRTNSLWLEDSRRLDNRFALANIGKSHIALFDDAAAKINEPVFKQLAQAGGFSSEKKGQNREILEQAVCAVCTSNCLPASKNDPALANRWTFLTVNNVPEKPIANLADRLKAVKDQIASYSLYLLQKWLPEAPARIGTDQKRLRQVAEQWAKDFTDAEEIPEFWAECIEPLLQRGRNVLPISEIQEIFIAWSAESAYSSEYIDCKAKKLLRTWGTDFRRHAEQKGGKIGTARTAAGDAARSLIINR